MDFDADVALDASDAWSLNQRAWFLATAPEQRHRDGAQALEVAQRACELTNWREGRYLDTLAAAYAEVGEFDSAIRWQMRALRMSPASRRLGCELRFELYLAGLPFHTPSRVSKPR